MPAIKLKFKAGAIVKTLLARVYTVFYREAPEDPKRKPVGVRSRDNFFLVKEL